MGAIDLIMSWAKLVQEAGKIDEYKEILNLLDQNKKQQEVIHELKDENKKLKEDLEIKWKIEHKYNFYYLDNEWPYCSKCWDVDKKLVRAIPTYKWSNNAECPNCKNIHNYTWKQDENGWVVTVDYTNYL